LGTTGFEAGRYGEAGSARGLNFNKAIALDRMPGLQARDGAPGESL
jgi:hypothetical protein